jgi:hypothetical protein
MGIFDKAEQEAEDMAQKDPNLAQQAEQFGGGQFGQDMQTAQNTIGRQGGSQDPNQGGYDPNQGGGYQDPSQQGGYQDPNQGGYDPNQGGGYQDPSQQGGYQDPNQQGGYDPDQDPNRNQNQGW